jgi:hypothetical protein
MDRLFPFAASVVFGLVLASSSAVADFGTGGSAVDGGSGPGGTIVVTFTAPAFGIPTGSVLYAQGFYVRMNDPVQGIGSWTWVTGTNTTYYSNGTAIWTGQAYLKQGVQYEWYAAAITKNSYTQQTTNWYTASFFYTP